MQQLKFSINNEEGSASLEFITAGVLLLVPLVYLVVVISAVQAATLATEGAARHAARVFVLADSVPGGQERATEAISHVLADYGLERSNPRVSITCSPSPHNCLNPRTAVTVALDVTVPLPLIPSALHLDHLVSVPISAQATQVMSRFHGAE